MSNLRNLSGCYWTVRDREDCYDNRPILPMSDFWTSHRRCYGGSKTVIALERLKIFESF